MSAYKRFEIWLNGICPNCKERKLKIIKPKRPIHFQCLNCDSKYYYPQSWVFLFMLCITFSEMSYPVTLKFALEKHKAEHIPSFPNPTTAILFLLFINKDQIF